MQRPAWFKTFLYFYILSHIFFSYAAPAAAQTKTPGEAGFNYATDAKVSDTIKQFLCAPTEPGEVSTNNTGGTAATTGNTAANDLNECINKLYRFTIAIASVIAVFFIVIGGYIYMSAGGNQESVDKAKNILETSVASLVILFGAYVLLRAINPDLIRIPSIQPPEVKYAGQLKYEDFVYIDMPDGTQILVPRVTGSGNIAGYNIASYATDPNHETRIASIYQKLSAIDLSTADKITEYMRKSASKQNPLPLTGQMVINSSQKYNVDLKLLLAIMQQDSQFGTAGKGARTHNPGNVQNDDTGKLKDWGTWERGVDAVAEWLSKHRK